MCNNSVSRRFLTTATTLLGLTLFAMTSNVLPAVAQQMGADFGLSEALCVKRMMPVQFIGFVLFCFLGGFASDRYGKKITMLLACVAVSLGCTIWVLAPNFVWLFIGAIILGMGGGILESVCSAALTDLHPDKSKLFMNLSQVFYCLGAIAIGSLAGLLVAQAVPWRAFYITLAVLGAILTIAYGFTKYPRKESEKRGAEKVGGGKMLGQLLPAIWLPSLAVFLYVFAETSLYAFGPNYMKQLGAGDQVATTSIAVFWVAVVIGRISCSFLPQKQGYEGIICTMFVISGLAACCQIFAHNWGAALALLALNGLACAGTWPMIISMITIRNFEYSGTASGFAIAVGAIGCIASPLTLGTVFDQGHAGQAYLLLGLSFFLGAACIAGTYFQYRRKLSGK